VPGDSKLKRVQTLRPLSFHEPNVLAYDKYDTLQTLYISHVHNNQGCELIIEPQISISEFIVFIQDNTFSDSSILTNTKQNYLYSDGISSTL
jgi:hypothetical protein